MVRYYIFLLASIFYMFSCSEQSNTPQLPEDNSSFNYVDGIYFEKSFTLEKDGKGFTSDNEIYKAGKSFIYNYTYFDPNNVPLYFEIKDLYGDEWNYIPIDSITNYTVTKIEMSVSGRPNRDSSYQQSPILYELINSSNKKIGTSGTGLVENAKNIWIHPPRQRLFKILQLNPYPFIKKPYEVGNTYQWSFKIGDHWGHEKWKTWTGTITNRQEYRIVKKENVLTNFGMVGCLKIVATGTNELGKTDLVSYFNDTIGFVKLEYINIDGSRLNMTLIKII